MTNLSDMEAWIRGEQAALWDDLLDDIRSAMNGRWSIAAGNRACRIVESARLVGPTDPNEMPWHLLASGIYEAVLIAGLVHPPSFDLRDETWVNMLQYGTPEALAAKYAGTLTAITDDHAFIRAGGR